MAHYSDIINQNEAFKTLEIALKKLEKVETRLHCAKAGDWSVPYILEELRDAELEVERARREYNEWLPSYSRNKGK